MTRALTMLAIVSALLGCGDDPEPAPPVADGDFCHGQPDGLICDDGSPCTVDDICGHGVCLGRPAEEASACDDGDACTEADLCRQGLCVGAPLDCDADPDQCSALGCLGPDCNDGDACTLDRLEGDTCVHEPVDCGAGDACGSAACNPDSGVCETTMADDGTTCNDGDHCTILDVCLQGTCAGTDRNCETGDACKPGTCDPSSGECVASAAPDGTSCDAANNKGCTVGAACQAGQCAGGTTADNGTACDDQSACTSADTCQAGICQGKAVVCDASDDECIIEVCVAEDGGCVPRPVDDGLPCNDESYCTTGETCQGGVCQGEAVLLDCDCTGKADGDSCNDGNGCTEGDQCVAEQCVGSVKTCQQPSNACMTATCSQQAGECIEYPRALGTSCDDSDSCTESDYCKDGSCVGTLKNCSQLDGPCVVGECTAGDCAVVSRPLHHPCDDGSACSGHDECDGAGSCAGTKPLCAICDGLPPGTACDDGDACTGAGVCAPVSNGGFAAVACIAPVEVQCDAVKLCGFPWCNADTGTCVTSDVADGVLCDDNNGCSEESTCQKGECVAAVLLNLCGAKPDLCESSADNDSVSSAIEVTLKETDDPLVRRFNVVGWFTTVGDVDWYEVALQPEEKLTVTTGPHCSEPTDTVLEVVQVVGMQVLPVAADDGGAGGGYAKISNLVATSAGTWLVGVSGHATAPLGAYELTIEVSLDTPCFVTADCGCAMKVCQEGQCVPLFKTENEPNDAKPAAEGPLLSAGFQTGGSSVIASFDDLNDEDWFALNLSAEFVYRLETSAYCDAPSTDPSMKIYAGTAPGLDALAQSTDAAGNGHALIKEFKPPGSGTYYVRVRDEGVSLGQYVLTLNNITCTDQPDDFGDANTCPCALETCQAGVCVAVAAAPEPIGPLEPAELLFLEEVHGSIETQYDVDSWLITLGPGKWSVITHQLCDKPPLDTELEVYNHATGELLAADADSGDMWFATVKSLEITEVLKLQINVSAHGAAQGDFVLRVELAAE